MGKRFSFKVGLPILLAGNLWGACAAEQPGQGIPRCIPGQAIQCYCSDGTTGAQRCRADGIYEPCVCKGGPGAPDGGAAAPAPPPVGPGLAAGSAAPLEPPGPDSAGMCAHKEVEWCDGKDNDCDGVVDNGHVCEPEKERLQPENFAGAVYLLGTMSEGSAGHEAVKQIWPLGKKVRTGFGPNFVHGASFHPRSGELILETTGGIMRVDKNEVIRTPPCGGQARKPGFDGEGTVYYQCRQSVRRGNGELLADGIRELVAVLADGRFVTAGSLGDSYKVWTRKGEELSTFDVSAWVGKMEVLPAAATVVGNSVTLLFKRTYGQDKEYVVVRLTPRNEWVLVRRARVKDFFSNYILALPNGTILSHNRLYSPDVRDESFVAYLPNGESKVIWSENASPDIKVHAARELFLGPAE